MAQPADMDVLLPLQTLPGVQDWVITLCQLASAFAIAASFFKVNTGSDATEEDENVDKLIDTRLFANVGATILLSTTTFVLLPRICARCCCRCSFKLRILHHPNFQATMQVYKLLVFVGSVCHFALRKNADGSSAFEVKTGYALLASLILAMCDCLFLLHIVHSTIYGDASDLANAYMIRGTNPRPRTRFAWIFFQLWSDVAILSTGVVEYQGCAFWIVPWCLYFTYSLAVEKSLTSLDIRYHLIRILTIAGAAVVMYLGSLVSSATFTLEAELTVLAILVVSEVVLAVCELHNESTELYHIDIVGSRLVIMPVIMPASYANL